VTPPFIILFFYQGGKVRGEYIGDKVKAQRLGMVGGPERNLSRVCISAAKLNRMKNIQETFCILGVRDLNRHHRQYPGELRRRKQSCFETLFLSLEPRVSHYIVNHGRSYELH